MSLDALDHRLLRHRVLCGGPSRHPAHRARRAASALPLVLGGDGTYPRHPRNPRHRGSCSRRDTGLFDRAASRRCTAPSSACSSSTRLLRWAGRRQSGSTTPRSARSRLISADAAGPQHADAHAGLCARCLLQLGLEQCDRPRRRSVRRSFATRSLPRRLINRIGGVTYLIFAGFNAVTVPIVYKVRRRCSDRT